MTQKLNRTEFGDQKNSGNVLSKDEAYQLLKEWVKNERLQLHMKQVAYLMKCWAEKTEKLNEKNSWRWELAGLLHDADWDQWPDEHCKKIVEELENRNVDPEIIHAIASHGPAYFGVEPVTKMDKMLYAFDELSGFVHAYSLMRPNGYEGMEVKGVLKRLKDKTFAAGVSREDLRDASERAGIPIDQIIKFVIENQAETII
jgi:predicted hydrolase (HD superfamily)